MKRVFFAFGSILAKLIELSKGCGILGKGRSIWGEASGTRRFIGAWALVILLDILALMGIARLGYDDGLVATFQSDSPRFNQFQTFSQTFGSHGADIFLLLEVDSFTDPASLLAVQDFVLELQLTEGVEAVVSAFSLPLPDGSDTPPRLQLEVSVTGPDLVRYLEDAFDRQPALARFLTVDGKSALVVVQSASEAGSELLETIDDLAAGMLSTAEISLSQAGYPFIRAGVIERLFSDFILLNVVGALAGTVIAAIALQSIQLAMLTAMASGTALLWVLGLMGFVGVQINVITVALPVLILVLSFADALHLSFETRRQVLEGNFRAIQDSVRRVGPACILASVTTAIAFGVLALSSSSLVAELGRAGAVSALLSGLAVLVVHPLLYATLGRLSSLAKVFSGRRGLPTPLANWTWLPAMGYRKPVTINAGALVVLTASVALFITVQPNFSLYENTATDDPARATTARISETFGPTSALHFIAPLDPAQPIVGLRAAQQALAKHMPGHEVFSLASVDGDIRQIPQAMKDRWLSADGTSGLISVTYRYVDATSTRALVEQLEAQLAADPDAGPLTGARATGLETMTSFVSNDMLRDLNRCFLVAVVISGLLVGLWLRDPLAGIVALVPNVLPIAIVGAWLVTSGRGLEFSSGLALTIAFGLAIDDTLHVLNRLRLNLGGTIWGGRDEVMAAVRQVLPTLVITSAVLSAGLLGTQLASLPSVAYFGKLSIAVFILALLADLVVLPTILIALSSRRIRKAAK